MLNYQRVESTVQWHSNDSHHTTFLLWYNLANYDTNLYVFNGYFHGMSNKTAMSHWYFHGIFIGMFIGSVLDGWETQLLGSPLNREYVLGI